MTPSSVFLLHKNEIHSLVSAHYPTPSLVLILLWLSFHSWHSPILPAGPASGPLHLLFHFPTAFLSDVPEMGSSLIFRIQLNSHLLRGSFLPCSPSPTPPTRPSDSSSSFSSFIDIGSYLVMRLCGFPLKCILQDVGTLPVPFTGVSPASEWGLPCIVLDANESP